MKNINIFLCLLLCIFLAACSKKSDESASQSQTEATSADAAAEATNNQVAADEKLGTKWGDEIDSHVTEVQLKRKSDSPLAETIVQYADKNYKGKTVNSISIAAGKVSFSVVDDHGNRIPMYRVGQSYYLSGREGQSYQLQYKNNTAKTFEVVASVDGVDVIDGSEASRSNSGYVLHAHDSLKIEGFRKSESAVASFTFSKPKDAYAANSENGSIQNAGVIGTVLYELEAPEDEAKPVNKYAPPPNAFPADR
ncbi:hypothetical protein ACG9X6_07780 [Acinetobacter guillouiae]|uniref:hypothetical protein n=1 Tax=Acinetobacter TaxID=469 RepID=UPI001FB9A876|nr:hypothetical protein [Acinetobacter sp. NyZ410]UOH19462.1 hypothetical protein MTO68_04615 [Acinetobacter sp. NyZ410]